MVMVSCSVMSHQVRSEADPPIPFRTLIRDADKYIGHTVILGGYILETKTMQWFWDSYCPDQAQREEAYASPLRADNLSKLPAALIVTAEFDPLRDEGEAYAEALDAAGTEATVLRYDGLVHDFLATSAMFECSRKGLQATVSAIKQHLN